MMPASDLRLHWDTGFILFEILVSLSVMAMVFMALFRMQSATIDLAATGRFNSIAPLLAEMKLSEIDAGLTDFEDGSGDFGEAYPGYAWACTVSQGSGVSLELPVGDTGWMASLRKIDLVIRDRQSERAFRISTWRHLDD